MTIGPDGLSGRSGRFGRVERVLTFPGGSVSAAEVSWRFSPSGGPGGQHANRSSTRAEAVIDLAEAGSMSTETRRKLTDQYGPDLRVAVDDTRSQARNRDIALDRLEQRLRDGLASAEPRRPTRPSGRARRRRLDGKRRRSETKRARRRIDPSGLDAL